jgi:hypothetical protein
LAAGRANSMAVEVVSLLEKRMHVPLVHQASEGNEESCRAGQRLSVPSKSLPGARTLL